jgi:hypothetical protein
MEASIVKDGISRAKSFMKRLWPQRSTAKRSNGVLRIDHDWSIGIYSGRSPVCFEPPPHFINPVLTSQDVSDVRASIVADPFMLNVQGIWYMFFEVLNRDTRKGEIGLATSRDGFTWQYAQIVLAEPFHLSYPYVFEWKDEYYMIPESNVAKEVRLYKASRFPNGWECVGVLLSGQHFSDSSIVRHGEYWWLFTETSISQFDTLRLFYSTSLTGPWREHSSSPIIQGDPHIARPAGRIVVHADRIIRYAQDCSPSYGQRVHAFEITDLTTSSYAEQRIQNVILDASGAGWNESGMHHIDPHLLMDGQWIACVDGRIEVEIRD